MLGIGNWRWRRDSAASYYVPLYIFPVGSEPWLFFFLLFLFPSLPRSIDFPFLFFFEEFFFFFFFFLSLSPPFFCLPVASDHRVLPEYIELGLPFIYLTAPVLLILS